MTLIKFNLHFRLCVCAIVTSPIFTHAARQTARRDLFCCWQRPTGTQQFLSARRNCGHTEHCFFCMRAARLAQRRTFVCLMHPSTHKTKSVMQASRSWCSCQAVKVSPPEGITIGHTCRICPRISNCDFRLLMPDYAICMSEMTNKANENAQNIRIRSWHAVIFKRQGLKQHI
jgi:hypothetical protein